ncbi:MAG: YwqG family protein [Pyrinomonadaceae bacterium]
MNDAVTELLIKHDLAQLESDVREFVLPCVGIDLVESEDDTEPVSKLGGNPYLPNNFAWPTNKTRPLELVLQVNLADVVEFDVWKQLPDRGLLTFFYDIEEQPWGFDPKDVAGFKVHYSPPELPVHQRQSPESEFKLPKRQLRFRFSQSVPSVGSRSYERLTEIIRFSSDDEADRFFDGFGLDLAMSGSSYKRNHWGGKHRLLGHSDNVQGDMQLEAELVSNGLYAGDPSGYEDPRALELESHADEWILLLQVDSDESIDLMWGDVGSIYYWIKREDLANRNFSNTWLVLQCS